jgi:hypothetical protein
MQKRRSAAVAGGAKADTVLRAGLLLLSGLLGAGCSVVGVRSGTEEPAYQLLERLPSDGADRIEIRRYGERAVISTLVDGPEEASRSDGFRRLAAYIFGANRERASIAMTVPVEQAAAPPAGPLAATGPIAESPGPDGRWRISFFAPAAYAAQALPPPEDGAVERVALPAQTYAVLTFSGSRSAESVAGKRGALLAALDHSSWRAAGETAAWFYDPPWTLPMFRRNEVAIPVVSEVRSAPAPDGR